MNLCFFTFWVQGEALVEFFEDMASMIDSSSRTGAAVEAHYQFPAWLVRTTDILGV